MAFAHAWSSVAGSWLGHAAGIRIRGSGLCNSRVSPVHTTGCTIYRGANFMKNARRATMICLLAFGMLALSATAWAQKAPIAEQIAKTYGLDSWGQIEAVRYTFNLDLPALNLKLSRTWTWEPKADRVTYEGKDKAGNPVKVTYVRSQLDSQPDNVKKEIELRAHICNLCALSARQPA